MTEVLLDPVSIHLGLVSGSQVYSAFTLRSFIGAHTWSYTFDRLDCKAGSKEVNLILLCSTEGK